MSRIDDALRRRRDQDGDSQLPVPRQELFEPVWPVNEQPIQSVIPHDARSHGGGAVEFSSKWGSALVNSPDSDPALVEQFRRLASTLHKARRMNGLRSVMVTSATSGDGKT